MTFYIAIGGSLHGNVQHLKCKSPYHHTLKLVRDAEGKHVYEIENYAVRRMRVGDTRREMFYLVLNTLSNEEAEKLVEHLEAEPEQPSPPAR